MRNQRNLTKDQVEWFVERIDESDTGRLIISTHLVNKYKKIIDEPLMTNDEARHELLDLNFDYYNDSFYCG